MKRRYQIAGRRAARNFQRMAAKKNPNIQMILPLAEVVSLLQDGVGRLLREAGLALMNLVMEEEVRQLAGERYQQHPERRAHRWGKEAGYCVVDGQKVPLRRTRLRDSANREQRLGSYELFQRSAPLERSVWDKMMRGLSTRNYGAVVKQFQQAYGIEKSAVSENFVEASREKLRELLERPLGELRICAVLIDGSPFRDSQMIVALGIGCDGRKTVLGLREGASENATVVSELLEDLARRGLDFSVPRLYVLDGSKALGAAVRRHAGSAACIQRCQVHKRRNVLDPLPQEHRQAVQRKLQNAYGMAEYAEAKRALEKLHGVDGPQSQRRPEPGRRDGRDAHGASAGCAGEAAAVAGQHQRDRVGLLDRRDGVPQREALAPRRSDRALGGIGTAGGRTTVPQAARLSGNPAAAGLAGPRGFQKAACQRSRRGVV